MNCSDCGSTFTVEPEELEWLAGKGKESPSECPRCRALREGLQDESVTCIDCNRSFVFPRELNFYSRLFHWPRPCRCFGTCRGGRNVRSPEEKAIFDFLRRLRSARMSGSTGRDAGGMPVERGPRPQRSSGDDEKFGSLADALKAFQDKKRGRRTPS
jgi:hypothetical protein